MQLFKTVNEGISWEREKENFKGRHQPLIQLPAID